jgi:hypothetical protein
VGLRAGLDAEARGKILYLCWGSNPGRPVSYPGLQMRLWFILILSVFLVYLTMLLIGRTAGRTLNG